MSMHTTLVAFTQHLWTPAFTKEFFSPENTTKRECYLAEAKDWIDHWVDYGIDPPDAENWAYDHDGDKDIAHVLLKMRKDGKIDLSDEELCGMVAMVMWKRDDALRKQRAS